MHARRTFFGVALGLLGVGSFAACGDGNGQVVVDSGTTPDVGPAPDTWQPPPVDAGNDAFDAPPTDAPGFNWPDCTSQPSSVPTKTIVDLWNDNPSTPTQVWIPGVYVTAISQNGCVANTACEFFLQQDLTYPDLATGAHHGIRAWITTKTSVHFTSLAVNQQVNVLAWAYRDTAQGANELILHVDTTNPGCALAVGTGTATPVSALLSDLDQISDYEQTIGPLLVVIANVTGTPKQPSQTFGLGNTYWDGSTTTGEIISLSPYFLSGGVFTGLTIGQKTKFTSVAGVYGLVLQQGADGGPAKYLEIYPRTMNDVVL